MIQSRAIKEFDPEARFYCSIAAAVLGAGALSAGASIWSANKASNAQTQAAQQGIQAQQQMYESNKNLLSPFIQAGQGGIDNLKNWIDPTSTTNPLSALVKLVTPGADMSSVLEQTPGYQFSANQGTRAAMNALAARGLGGSPGAIAKGVGGYVSGLASNTWDSVVRNLLNTFSAGGNALQNFVNSGADAGKALAGVGSDTANSVASLLTGSGNTQAAGYNAIGNAIGGAANGVPSALLLQRLMDKSGSIYNFNAIQNPAGGAYYGPLGAPE